MAIVDLRGRAEDPDVRELVRLASRGAGGDRPEPSPLLVAWREGDELVGGLGVERADDREIRLRNLFVREEFRLRGIGRSLVEAVVAGAPAERFVATSDAATAGFFERCGFTVTDGACVRTVPTVPAPPEAVAAVTLGELEAAIRGAWGGETSADPGEWTTENPARGQCDATAAVVRAYLGGEIVVADVLQEGRRVERHAWNRLPSGLAVDLTREQFLAGEQLARPAVQEPLMLGNARERHALLAERVRVALAGS